MQPIFLQDLLLFLFELTFLSQSNFEVFAMDDFTRIYFRFIL